MLLNYNYDYKIGIVSSKITLVILQDKQRKSNARIEMYC